MRTIFTVMLLVGSVQMIGQESSHSFPLHYTLHAMHADIIPLTENEKFALADAVFEGEIIATQSFWKNNRIASSLTIASAGEQSVYEVELLGGAFENMGAFCTGEMYLNTGARGRFFLTGSHAEGWRPACGVQSFESHARDVRPMGWERSDVGLSAEWSAGNAGQFLTLTGNGFGNQQGAGYVTFETGNGYYDAAAAANFNYTNWSNTSITIEVPAAQSNRVRVVTNDGTLLESSDSLHIGYNLGSQPGSSYGSTHLNNQINGGHLFHVNEAIFNEPERMDAVQRTLDDFVCKTGVNFQLSDEATSWGWDLGDGQNTISFDSPSNPLSPGTVGYCNTLWWSCILGDITFYVVGEMDVVLNSNFDYDYSTGPVGAGQAKFAYVLMHELGHAMRLGHVNEWGETMYPSVTNQPSNNWCERDTISTNDRLGVTQSVEIASTFTFSACGISAMVPIEVDCQPIVEVAEIPKSKECPFPNPFHDVINLPGDQEWRQWQLTNLTGSVVATFPVPPMGLAWSTSNLSAGSYVLSCVDCAVPSAHHVVKQP